MKYAKYFVAWCLISGVLLADESCFVNVKDFGAKGDGETDDTKAIQSAIDSLRETGGEVFFPVGKYRITKSILLFGKHHYKGNNWITLRGVGGGSVLMGDGVRFILAADTKANKVQQINGVRVDGLTFTSFNPKKRCGGIDASYFLRWWCYNCNFYILTTGIFATDKGIDGKKICCFIIRIHNNLFASCNDWAIKMARVFDLVITNNVIENCAGGIAIGYPGDNYDASANTIRIEDNVIEGIVHRPAILGSCWVGARIAGNYFEANYAGDILITPKGKDGWTRGLVIESNTFQPTSGQLKSGKYGPIKLTKTMTALITGNFTTGGILVHPESQLGPGVNVVANILNNPREIGTVEGAKSFDPIKYMGGRVYGPGAEKLEVCGPRSIAGIHSANGFYYQLAGMSARSITYGIRPTKGMIKRSPGDIVFTVHPKVKNGKVHIGWIWVNTKKGGKWIEIWTDVGK